MPDSWRPKDCLRAAPQLTAKQRGSCVAGAGEAGVIVAAFGALMNAPPQTLVIIARVLAALEQVRFAPHRRADNPRAPVRGHAQECYAKDATRPATL